MTTAEQTLAEIEALLPRSAEPNIVDRVRSLVSGIHISAVAPTATLSHPLFTMRASAGRAGHAPTQMFGAAIQPAIARMLDSSDGESAAAEAFNRDALAAIQQLQSALGIAVQDRIPGINITRDGLKVYFDALVLTGSQARGWLRLHAWMTSMPESEAVVRWGNHGFSEDDEFSSCEVLLLPPFIDFSALERKESAP